MKQKFAREHSAMYDKVSQAKIYCINANYKQLYYKNR